MKPTTTRRALRLTAQLIVLGLIGGTGLTTATSVRALTIGGNLETRPNGSVCNFESPEPETRVCTVGQRQLQADHTAPGGLTAPFDGVVTQWSVVSGPISPGTGAVTLALREMSGPGYLEKGPEVTLPPNAPGTRHIFPERMSISAGQPIGVKVKVTNKSSQEAGAPIAFRETGVGVIDKWIYGTAEPQEAGTIFDQEEGVELLLDAEIEPDRDGDGFGDLTQDCFPNHPGDQELCGRDLQPPAMRWRAAPRQPFLSSGAIVIRVASSEPGQARAEGWLSIAGRATYRRLRSPARPVSVGRWTILRVPLAKRQLSTARTSARAGRSILFKGRVLVRDVAGMAASATFRVGPR